MTVTQAELLTRDQVPVHETWDLSPLYAGDAAWNAELDLARTLVSAAAAHRGRLGESAVALRAALDDSMTARQTIERLYVYARLRLDENTADTEANGRLDRVTALSIEAGEQLAFFDPEVLEIPEETVRGYMQDPALATYHHLLDDLLRGREHTRSIEIEEILAQATDLSRVPRDVFGALDNVDLDYGTVLDEDGNPVALTKGRYQALLEGRNREVRARAYDAMMGEYQAHKHTLAALHASSVRKDLFFAKARRFASAREAALFSYNIPASVYDNLVAATREARPVMERFYALRRRALGVDELAVYDLYVPLAEEPKQLYSYDEGVDLVLRGVAALGSEYVDALGAGLRGRWVDVHETKGKRSGAYSWGAYGRPPVILMNWNGTVDHVFTLAHEAGHAMHSYLADRSQPFHDAQYSIFLAEVASTLNEQLLTWQMLAETPEDDVKGRFSILNRLADAISGTLIRQVMFAEFEHRTHQAVEAGQPLTLDTLNDIYGDVMDAYNPGVRNDELAKLTWSRVPHFYGAFYVYQYATGISAAIALARAIRDEGEPARQRFVELLKSGGRDYPIELLKQAGVDFNSPEPVRAALAEFDATIAEMEQLADRGALA